MFDMSWGEVLVIGAVALIVIGPKELPRALRTVGQMTSKVRRMASEFQSQFNDAMREAELDDVKKDLQGMTSQVSSFNPIQTVRDELRNAIEAKPQAGAAPDTAGTSPPAGSWADPSPASIAAAEPELPLPPPAAPPPAIESPAEAPPQPSAPPIGGSQEPGQRQAGG